MMIGWMFLHVFFVLVLGYYFITALQWYSYKIERVLFHYSRYDWHLYFFVIPVLAYYFLNYFYELGKFYFAGYLVLLLLPTLYLWYKKLDKKLVFTARVKRFFAFLMLATLFQDFLCIATEKCFVFGVLLPLIFSYLASLLFEKILFESYKKEALRKLNSNKNMKIIAITASYGKTSIKNFLYEVLSKKYRVYKTPRSVNTLGGVVKDINDNLEDNLDFYIVEAGARQSGDIDEIAGFLNHHIAIVGEIGEQHIEYFKTLQNIRDTKMELLNSKRLEIAFVSKSTNVKPNDKVIIYDSKELDIKATLDGVEFSMPLNGKKEKFKTTLLGSFNAANLQVVILTALHVNMSLEEIKKAIEKISPVKHRLQKIEAGGKIIIDDSFNGNLQGMLDSYNLASEYKGRKVIITPGIVESDKESNIKLAKKINSVFDLVIITGKTNQKILDTYITKPEKILLKEKSNIEDILKEYTFEGDLILFSNDAPTYM